MTQRRVRIGLLGLLALGLSSAALAADVPGNRSTTAVIKTGLQNRIVGTVESAGDSDWYRVRLQGGKNYAFKAQAQADITVRLRLRKLDGTILRTADATANCCDGGFEFQPSKDLTFFVELRDVPGISSRYPDNYFTSVAVDARGDIKTKATIAVGGTINGVANWGGDGDYFRTSLQGGKTYTIAVDYHGFLVSFFIVNAAGQKVAGGRFASGPGSFERLTGIRIPTSGTYYVVVAGGDDIGHSYTLKLTTP